MSTNATIARRLPNGQYKSIHLQYDGYVEWVAARLRKSFNDTASVEKLLDLGNLSELGFELAAHPDSGHTFETPVRGVCIAYKRDRGESGQEPIVSPALAFDTPYTYIWNGEEWEVYKGGIRMHRDLIEQRLVLANA